MALLLEYLLALVSVIFVLYWVVYSYVTQKFNYWKERAVPHAKPSFPFGSLSKFYLGKRHVGEAFDELYRQFKDVPYFGVFEGRNPTFVIKDPNLIKHILVKDFDHFKNRLTRTIPLNKHDYINNHLFNMEGREWKDMRLKLTPTFTSGKMKAMFHLMQTCGDQLRNHMEKELTNSSIVDVKDCLARFTMDIIATCAFGLEVNSQSDKNCEFYIIGMKIFSTSFYTLLRRAILSTFPIFAEVHNPVMIRKEVSDFLTKAVKSTVEYRRKNQIERNDFMDLLIKIRQGIAEESNENGILNSDVTALPENSDSNSPTTTPDREQNMTTRGLTIEEMTAQAFVFFAAGFETASSTLTFCLYELARHPKVQDRLHQELSETLSKHGGLTYAALQDMPYMDQVINETLRMYASVPVLQRTCTKAYKVPGDAGLVLEKGQNLIIPSYSLHHDPQYYPEPFSFDPERFTAERVKERHPYLHLPFGQGPRMCIGMRFGLLQTKIGLTEMVSNFEIKPSDDTQTTIGLHKHSFVTQPEKPILLHLTKRP